MADPILRIQNLKKNFGDLEVLRDVDMDVEIDKESTSTDDVILDIENIPEPQVKGTGQEPRWLRIEVEDLATGKKKVNVNVPFGMIKFGFGIAQAFTPDAYRADLEHIAAIMSGADSGVLVDVEDYEDNEHVRIYFD